MTDAPELGVRDAIVKPLIAFNNTRASQPESYRPLVIILSDHDTDEIIGGLWGGTNFSHLHVDLLFVPDSLRGTGLGRKMMLQAEQEAIARGCRGAWLDTYSFQARALYEQLGYTAFGVLDDYPPGQQRIFLRKQLDR
ncbi:GNAT family N-acetyltransferase [Bradyrhizobium sp. STM 3843]|uniref:GNAT family N-acetyltransferase n=1 Tax=Bradyrhizobium sp. STM 3843 TaxID=551947 RepID=UPI00191BE54D|nr:GNAT family N-acetyltransferase [Bradyrhizobium sp. STM 3843]